MLVEILQIRGLPTQLSASTLLRSASFSASASDPTTVNRKTVGLYLHPDLNFLLPVFIHRTLESTSVAVYRPAREDCQVDEPYAWQSLKWPFITPTAGEERSNKAMVAKNTSIILL